MADNNDSKDRSLEALDLIINVLKEHEQHLDKSFHEMAAITEQIGETKDGLKNKVEEIEEKITNLQKEVTKLITIVSTSKPKGALPAKIKEQTGQTTPSPALESKPTMILRCTQWEDFQALAMNADTLSFNYKEEIAVLEVNAIKGNQLIKYTGAFPNLSMILKRWLSLQLDIPELNILEGSVENLK
jgi:chaperonin cofactor prefoldin